MKVPVTILGSGMVAFYCARFFQSHQIPFQMIGPSKVHLPFTKMPYGMDERGSTWEVPKVGGRTRLWGGWWSDLSPQDVKFLVQQYPEWKKLVARPEKVLSTETKLCLLPKPRFLPENSGFLSDWPFHRRPMKLLGFKNGMRISIPNHFLNHKDWIVNKVTEKRTSKSSLTEIHCMDRKGQVNKIQTTGPVLFALSPLQTARVLGVQKATSYSNHRVRSVYFKTKKPITKKEVSAKVPLRALFIFNNDEICAEILCVSKHELVLQMMISERPHSIKMVHEAKYSKIIDLQNQDQELNVRIQPSLEYFRSQIEKTFGIASETSFLEVNEGSGIWHGTGTLTGNKKTFKERYFFPDGSLLPSQFPAHPSASILRWSHTVLLDVLSRLT